MASIDEQAATSPSCRLVGAGRCCRAAGLAVPRRLSDRRHRPAAMKVKRPAIKVLSPRFQSKAEEWPESALPDGLREPSTAMARASLSRPGQSLSSSEQAYISRPAQRASKMRALKQRVAWRRFPAPIVNSGSSKAKRQRRGHSPPSITTSDPACDKADGAGVRSVYDRRRQRTQDAVAPVINVNWFEARATTALPTSSVVPIRPRGVRRSQSSVQALSTLEIMSERRQ